MGQTLCVVADEAEAGKTTIAVLLARLFAAAGSSTLLVDLDGRGLATSTLGLPRSAGGLLPRICRGDAPNSAIGQLIRSVDAGLDLIPGDIEWMRCRLERPRHEAGVREAFEPLKSIYDFILLDCPPNEQSSAQVPDVLDDPWIEVSAPGSGGPRRPRSYWVLNKVRPGMPEPQIRGGRDAPMVFWVPQDTRLAVEYSVANVLNRHPGSPLVLAVAALAKELRRDVRKEARPRS